MEPKESQGPSRTTLLVSVVVLCVALVGVAYFLRDESHRVEVSASLPAASTLQPLFDRCEGEPGTEVVDGLKRTTCTSRSHPAFMVYQDATADVIVRAGIMVPLYGNDQQLEERKLVGLEMFSLVAGVPVETFLQPEVLADVGVSMTRVVHEGLVYQTQPMANVGLVFTVMAEPEAHDTEN